MSKKIRATRGGTTFRLVLSVIIASSSVYMWKLIGCIGFPDCYLCNTFKLDDFLNSTETCNTDDDFARLIDLNNFTFLINNLNCSNSDLILLVLVSSDPRNFEKRVTIRTTWGKTISEKFKLLFLLGATSDTNVQKQLNTENHKNKDLIQGNFLDTYRNLTYKHVMALKWTKYFCPKIKYLMKTDDDIFVNSPRLLKYMNGSLGLLPKTKLIQCRPIYEGQAWRTYRSKWRVTWSEYKFRMYPTYCQGFAILYSSDVVATLYAKAQMANYFWIDDVFVTGFLASSANYTPSTFGTFILERDYYYNNIKKDFFKNFSYLIGPWDLQGRDIRRLWKQVLNQKT